MGAFADPAWGLVGCAAAAAVLEARGRPRIPRRNVLILPPERAEWKAPDNKPRTMNTKALVAVSRDDEGVTARTVEKGRAVAAFGTQ